MAGGALPVEITAETHLPSYDSPPVVEVVVGVAFRSLRRLPVVDLGGFWDGKLRDHFPRVQEQTPYVPPMELSGAQSISVPNIWPLAFPHPRLWFLSNDEQELLQLQRDYLACNWRKVSPTNEYARWPNRRKAFIRWFEEFE